MLRNPFKPKNPSAAQEAKTLCNQSWDFGNLGQWDKAITVCDEVITRFAKSSDSGVRAQAARASFNKAIAFKNSNQHEKSFTAYDDAVRFFEHDADPEIRVWVAKILVDKAAKLSEFTRHAEAIEVCDKVVNRFASDSDPVVRGRIATALVTKANCFVDLERPNEAISAFEEVVKRFDKDVDVAVQVTLAHALANKALTLSQIGRYQEAIGAYDSVVQRFKGTNEPALLEVVTEALRQKQRIGVSIAPEESQEVEQTMLHKDIAKFLGEWKDLDAHSFGAFIKDTKVPAFVVVHASQSTNNATRADEFVKVLERIYGIYTMGALTSQQPLPQPWAQFAAFDLDVVPSVGQQLSAKLGITVTDAPALALFNQGKLIGICRWNENPDALINQLFNHLNAA